MSRILILYSTVDGQTLRICERMKAVAEALGNEVVLASIDDSDGSGMSACDKVVIGASIRYGKHRQSVFDFVETNRRVLDAVPTDTPPVDRTRSASPRAASASRVRSVQGAVR